MNNIQDKISLFTPNSISPKEWQLNADLDVELQARPIETDNLDLLLSPLTKVSNQPKIFLDAQKNPRVSYLSVIGNNMMAFYNLKKFLQKLSKNRENFKKLTSKHLDIINDSASDQTVLLNSTKNKPKLKIFDFPQLLSQLSKQHSNVSAWKKTMLDEISKIPLLNPDSKRKLVWDYFMTALRIVLMILIPLEIGFEPGIVFDEAQIFTAVTMLLTIIDTLLRLNTVYYVDGKAINDRWKIFELKIQESLIFDIIALLALIANFGYVLRSVLPAYFLQFKYVYEVINKSQESSYLSKPIQGLMKLIWFILTLLSILHIFSCIWFLISINTQGDNWVKAKGIEHSSWSDEYIEALYFSTVTMLTIGYGDSVPQNQIEKIVSIVFILVACLWYSYAVNTIGQIINELTYNSEKRRQRIRVINGYMAKRKVPFSLQFKIREYLNYRWKEEQESDLTLEDKLVNELSNELKQELEILGRKNFIEKCKFLQHFSSEFRRSVSLHIKRIIIQPHNTFSMKEEPCVCYVESGQLQYMMSDVKEGQFLQQYEFIIDQQTAIPYKAIGYVSLLIIPKDSFMSVLKTYQNDHEQFCSLYQKLLSNELKYLLGCEQCNTHGHFSSNCPLIQYNCDKELVIKRHCFPKTNERVFIIRNRVRNYFKSLSEMELIQEYVTYFQTEKQAIIQDQLKRQLSDSQINLQVMRKQSLYDDDFLEFGARKKSIHDHHNARSPNHRIFGQSLMQSSNIAFLGVQRSKQSEIEKSFLLKTIQPNVIEEEMIQNITALYQKTKAENSIDKNLEILYLKYNSQTLPNFDHVKSFKSFFPQFNVQEVIKKKREVYKSYFAELIKYMFYPFLFVLKFNKISHKRKMTNNFQQVNNLVKFKKALLNKKRRQTSVFPNGQPLIPN